MAEPLTLAQRLKVHIMIDGPKIIEMTQEEAGEFFRLLDDWEKARRVIEAGNVMLIAMANFEQSVKRRDEYRDNIMVRVCQICIGLTSFAWLMALR